MPNTVLITATLSLLSLVLLVVLAFKLRRWVWNIHRDITTLRNAVGSIKDSISSTNTAINNLTAESVNAACISSLGFRFPVFLGGPSIDTHHARNLIFHLQERKPRAILELGSGSSTIIIARALQTMGASPDVHISVDHEDRFLGNTRELARLNGVDDLVQFEHCPLEQLEGFTHPWYSRIPELAKSYRFDFVVVDGPPAYAVKQSRSREPALAVIRPYLAKNAMVILDDANRPGELDVIKTWIENFPEFDLFHAKEGKGVAILTLKS